MTKHSKLHTSALAEDILLAAAEPLEEPGKWPHPSWFTLFELADGSVYTPEITGSHTDESIRRLKSEPGPVELEATLKINPEGRWVDETISIRTEREIEVKSWWIGPMFNISDLPNFRLHPLPFKVGLDGTDRSRQLEGAQDFEDFAEGWILENGENGLLVMRLPSPDALTCFVPAVLRTIEGERLLQVGAVGLDGPDHRSCNAFLKILAQKGNIDIPTTRYVFYQGGWEEGVALFRSTVAEHTGNRPYRPAPVTYNTFHDFGPSYDKQKLMDAMPRLQDLGIGLMHLDPGWETVWGSAIWNDSEMGSPREFVEAASAYGMKVGCWTSFHTTDPDTLDGMYALDVKGQKYFAEQFGNIKLHAVCPFSHWREHFERNMARLMEAGFVFVNSDFHDWPWSGESCHSKQHYHTHPPERYEWANAVNEAFRSLRKNNRDVVIEMHDHVESGEYRTPVWYLYGQPDSYDEKWAYEFMWTTHQDLLDEKLFALYHLRKAEPVPLFLHINMMSDNENALAFWYVASCVNHIGIGGALKAPEPVFRAYRKAIKTYNRFFEEFTCGEFVGIDELTHVHVNREKDRGVLLCFNLEDRPVTRNVTVDISLQFPHLKPIAATGDISPFTGNHTLTVPVTIGAKDVCIVPLKLSR